MRYINNYNHYNKFKESYGLISATWDKSPPKEELDAQFEYKLIETDDLILELEDLVKECLKNLEEKAESKYLEKVEYLIRKGLNKNDIDIEMKSFLRKSIISLNNSDNQFYRELISENKTKRRLLILNKLNNIQFYIHKLLFINHFKESLDKVSLLESLYKKYYEESNSTKENRPKLAQIVMRYYYVHASGEEEMFENSHSTKIAAIQAALLNYHWLKSVKNFQSKYNKINFYRTNRIALNQVSNIKYVIDYLLNDYPKAKKIAINELKEARSKAKN